MVCSIQFINLVDNKCIPVKVYVDRQKILENSVVSISEKSIVELKQINVIKLSKSDTSDLIASVADDIENLLLRQSLLNLSLSKKARNNKVTNLINVKRWRCLLKASPTFITNVRLQTGFLTEGDLEFVESRTVEKQNLSLLRATKSFTFKEEAKETSHNIKKKVIIGTLKDCLEIYVHDKKME